MKRIRRVAVSARVAELRGAMVLLPTPFTSPAFTAQSRPSRAQSEMS